MTTLLAPLPVQAFKDSNGNPLSGGQLYTYAAGTSTLLTTYTDSTAATPNTNPIILNSRGECGLWLTSGQSCKLVLQDSYGVLIWSVDQIVNGASSGANSDITSLSGLATPLSITQGGTGAIAFDAARYALSASSDPMRNRIINGDIAVDPAFGASTTFTAAAQLQVANEMFYGACTGANVTGQQIAQGDGTFRYQFTGAALNSSVTYGTRIESKNVRKLPSSTATLSTRISSTGVTLVTWYAYYANTADTFGTLGSYTRTLISSGTFTISSVEAVYSTQIAIPAAALTGIEIVFTTGALVAGQTLTFGDTQLERGAISLTAITFEFVDIALQTQRCQRYFEPAVAAFIRGTCANASGNLGQQVYFKTSKRATPTITQAGTVTVANVVSEPTGGITTEGFQYQIIVSAANTDSYVSGRFYTVNARL